MNRQMVPLGALVAPKGLQTGPFGSQLKAEEYTENGVPVVMPKDIFAGKIVADEIARVSEEKASQLAKHMLQPGDIIFPRRGDLGRIAVAEDENKGWLCGTGCLRVRLKDNVDTNYIHQYVQLATVKQWLESNALGQTMPNLNTEIIGNLPVFLVSKREQVAIAEILSIWDEGIEKNERNITVKKRQLYDSYQKYLQPGTLVNCSWASTRISEFVKPRREIAVPQEEIPLYSLTIEDGITPKTDRYDRSFLVTDINTKTYKVVYPGDIVFNPANLRWGAIARSNALHKVTISPIYEVLEIKNDTVNPDYLFYALTCPRQIEIFASKTEGTLIERMSVKLKTFLTTEILHPTDTKVQNDIASLLNIAIEEITLMKEIAEKYKAQKRGLMQKLLTGQWRVKVDEKVEHGE